MLDGGPETLQPPLTGSIGSSRPCFLHPMARKLLGFPAGHTVWREPVSGGLLPSSPARGPEGSPVTTRATRPLFFISFSLQVSPLKLTLDAPQCRARFPKADCWPAGHCLVRHCAATLEGGPLPGSDGVKVQSSCENRRGGGP